MLLPRKDFLADQLLCAASALLRRPAARRPHYIFLLEQERLELLTERLFFPRSVRVVGVERSPRCFRSLRSLLRNVRGIRCLVTQQNSLNMVGVNARGQDHRRKNPPALQRIRAGRFLRFVQFTQRLQRASSRVNEEREQSAVANRQYRAQP